MHQPGGGLQITLVRPVYHVAWKTVAVAENALCSTQGDTLIRRISYGTPTSTAHTEDQAVDILIAQDLALENKICQLKEQTSAFTR